MLSPHSKMDTTISQPSYRMAYLQLANLPKLFLKRKETCRKYKDSMHRPVVQK